jgi:hypothetical protein
MRYAVAAYFTSFCRIKVNTLIVVARGVASTRVETASYRELTAILILLINDDK